MTDRIIIVHPKVNIGICEMKQCPIRNHFPGNCPCCYKVDFKDKDDERLIFEILEICGQVHNAHIKQLKQSFSNFGAYYKQIVKLIPRMPLHERHLLAYQLRLLYKKYNKVCKPHKYTSSKEYLNNYGLAVEREIFYKDVAGYLDRMENRGAMLPGNHFRIKPTGTFSKIRLNETNIFIVVPDFEKIWYAEGSEDHIDTFSYYLAHVPYRLLVLSKMLLRNAEV